MKIGVLTFHRASNYGTALQAYATVKALSSMGIEAELIDYRPEYTERTVRKKGLKDVKSIKALASLAVNKIIYGNQLNGKIDRFASFIDSLPVSSEICHNQTEAERIAAKYDVILSGSDQLWNERITGKDMMYFFPFPHPKKISYASSFGVSILSEERKKEILPYLLNFKFIAVREKTAHNILGQMLPSGYKDEHPIYQVIDPTLLISKDEWREQANPEVRLPKNGYILTYYMIETPMLRSITEKLKRETGLPVVNIKPSKKQMLLREGTNMMWAGPREFLSCYVGAKYVVTNSFHGTVFAINFDIPVYASSLPVSMAGEVNSRLIDVLDMYGLSERWIASDDDLNRVDANKVVCRSSIKEQRRAESLEILNKMLGMEKHND